jgi:hypothetical protein
MLAKAIRNRAPDGNVAQDFRARVNYVCAKATTVYLGNLVGTWRDAAFQMRVSAGLNPRLRSPVYHLVLSWPETEQPSDPEVVGAARRVVADLGARAHQFVIAVHRDRVNTHAHVVLNRVHPVSGTSLFLSHDYLRLERACRRVEQTMGWPPDRGRFDTVITGDTVQLIPKPAAHWEQKIADRERGLRPDGRAVRGHERRSGLPALRDVIPQDVRRQLGTLVERAKGWMDIHLILGTIGLRYMPHGSGARIVDPGRNWFMAANQLGAGFGLRRMQSRLGPFQPDQDAIAAGFDPILPPDHAQAAALQGLVRGIAERHATARTQRRARNAARRDLAANQVREARQVRQFLNGSRWPFARALRRAMRETHREERRRLKQQNSTPGALPFDATSEIARRAPCDMCRRRYRHILRQREEWRALTAADRQPDHTALRQSWVLAAGRDDPHVPERLAAILARHADDLRADGSGRLLLARRNPHGSITGFEVLPLGGPQIDSRIMKDSGTGLGLVGARDARVCVIVEDAAAALMQITISDGQNLLVIATGQHPGNQNANHLRSLAQGRSVWIAVGQDVARSGFGERLRDLLPQARWNKGNPGDLWRDFHSAMAAEAKEAARSQSADAQPSEHDADRSGPPG